MRNDDLKLYVIGCLKTVEQDLFNYSKSKSLDVLHHLRVEIKKIKAIFGFYEKIHKQKVNVNKLKLVFKNAGEIRELHRFTELLKSMKQAPEKLIAQIAKREVLLQQRFLKNSSTYIKDVKDFRKKIILPDFLSDKKAICECIKKKVRKNEKKLRERNKDGLHSFRTKIKEIMYVYEALPKSIQKKIRLNYRSFDKLQKKLGDWHDTNSAIDFFTSLQDAEKMSLGISKLKRKEEKQIKGLFKHTQVLTKK